MINGSKGFGGRRSSRSSSKRRKRPTTWDALVQEARAVSLWSLLSLVTRAASIVMSLVVNHEIGGTDEPRDLSGTANTAISVDEILGIHKWPSWAKHKILLLSFVVAGLVLWLVPSKVAAHKAPGFCVANPWCVARRFIFESRKDLPVKLNDSKLIHVYSSPLLSFGMIVNFWQAPFLGQG